MDKDYSQYRNDAIKQRLHIMGVYPLDVMVTGVTGAGKSTTLNTFFQRTVASVGNGVNPETMKVDKYILNKYFRIWDTPGLGDGIANDRKHTEKMLELMNKTYNIDGQEYGVIDMILVIIDGSNRDLGTTYKLLNEVIVPNFVASRILVAINQADFSLKGRHWNCDCNTPDNILISFLENKALSIQKRIKEATGVIIKKPIYYSAVYRWNVDNLFDFIIDNIPREKRILKC